MKYTADCPACANTIEIPDPAAACAGMRCPKCDVGFMPKIITQFEPLEETVTAQDKKWREYKRLREDASTCFVFAMIFIVACIIVALAGIISGGLVVLFSISRALFLIFLAFLILSQFLHLRAGQEKLYNKD